MSSALTPLNVAVRIAALISALPMALAGYLSLSHFLLTHGYLRYPNALSPVARYSVDARQWWVATAASFVCALLLQVISIRRTRTAGAIARASLLATALLLLFLSGQAVDALMQLLKASDTWVDPGPIVLWSPALLSLLSVSLFRIWAKTRETKSTA